MKKLLSITIIILLAQNAASQTGLHFNQKEYFTISTSIDPVATYEQSGPDVVLEAEYVGIVYAKAGVEYFPTLTPAYFDIHAAIGINLMLNTFNDFRMYAGVRGARVYR